MNARYEDIFMGSISPEMQCKLHINNKGNIEYLGMREDFLKEIVSDHELYQTYKMINRSFYVRFSPSVDLFIVYLSHKNPNDYKKLYNFKFSFNSMAMKLKDIQSKAKFRPGQMLCVREFKDYEMYFKMGISARKTRGHSLEKSSLESKILDSFNISSNGWKPHDFKALSVLRSPVMVMEAIPLFFGSVNKEQLCYRIWIPQCNDSTLIHESALKPINSHNWRHKNMKEKEFVKNAMKASAIFRRFL